MPRQAESLKSSSKPYSKLMTPPEENSTNVHPQKTTRTSGQGWTSNELVKIFEVVTKHGPSKKNFQGIIDGRTANQCYMTWKWVRRRNIDVGWRDTKVTPCFLICANVWKTRVKERRKGTLKLSSEGVECCFWLLLILLTTYMATI